jgi:hypothetical protein
MEDSNSNEKIFKDIAAPAAALFCVFSRTVLWRYARMARIKKLQ